MNGHFGDLHWWPAETPFEMAVGAILTQNTAWTNASRAVEKLRGAGLLDPSSLYQAERRHIAEAVQPAGFYNIKTDRLTAFVDFLHERYGGTMEAMFDEETGRLRELLLSVRGIGKETADSILLYGDNRPVFVVDAYTKRILERHGVVDQGRAYDEVQRLFADNLPCEAALFNQYHALLVNTGKMFCRRSPRCGGCPLRDV
ncbi:MAG TPA: endonuclease III domain-containing protein [Deltaproteobacteria bacterium]|nr:endonuclease III domain-containing protein [Deltaproteobacteria bacterium]